MRFSEGNNLELKNAGTSQLWVAAQSCCAQYEVYGKGYRTGFQMIFLVLFRLYLSPPDTEGE